MLRGTIAGLATLSLFTAASSYGADQPLSVEVGIVNQFPETLVEANQRANLTEFYVWPSTFETVEMASPNVVVKGVPSSKESSISIGLVELERLADEGVETIATGSECVYISESQCVVSLRFASNFPMPTPFIWVQPFDVFRLSVTPNAAMEGHDLGLTIPNPESGIPGLQFRDPRNGASLALLLIDPIEGSVRVRKRGVEFLALLDALGAPLKAPELIIGQKYLVDLNTFGEGGFIQVTLCQQRSRGFLLSCLRVGSASFVGKLPMVRVSIKVPTITQPGTLYLLKADFTPNTQDKTFSARSGDLTVKSASKTSLSRGKNGSNRRARRSK